MEEERPTKRLRTVAPVAREVGLMRSIPAAGDNFSGFVGSASGIYFIRSVYSNIRRAQPMASTQIETPGSDIVPGEDDHLPSNSSGRLWNNSEVTQGPTPKFSFQDLVSWSASYFANWHPAYPFLHAPTVLEYFDTISHSNVPQQDSPNTFQMTILRSLMSISLADRRQSSARQSVPYPASILFSSYDAAVESLKQVLSHPTSMLALQAAISVQLFLVSMLRLNAASRLGGLIIRMALQLGLHRCPARFSSFSSSERQLRQRVFWSVYAIDRFICQSMGLPLGLHDDDIDVCFPSVECHEDIRGSPDNKLRVLDLLARQSEIRGEIMELRNKSMQYVQKDPEQATVITAKLTQWWNDVEEHNDSGAEQEPSAYFSTILTMLRHESIISFYRPILTASHKDATYDAALQQCIGSARHIITSLHGEIKPKATPGDEHKTMALLWPSCTWAVWISTFVLFYAANNNHISQNIVVRLANRSLDILEHLSLRGSAWPEASSAAIRDLLARMMQRPAEPTNKNPLGTSTVEITNRMPSSQQSPTVDEGLTSRSTIDHMADYDTPSTAQTAAPDKGIFSSNNNTAGNNLEYDLSIYGLQNDGWSDFLGANDPIDSSALLTEHNTLDPFSGFDIPFWFEQEQYSNMWQ